MLEIKHLSYQVEDETRRRSWASSTTCPSPWQTTSSW